MSATVRPTRRTVFSVSRALLDGIRYKDESVIGYIIDDLCGTVGWTDWNDLYDCVDNRNRLQGFIFNGTKPIPWVKKAVKINLSNHFKPETKERKLIQLFKEHGYKLSFTGSVDDDTPF